MNFETISGVIRHVLTFGGGWLAARGYIDETTMIEAVGAIMTIIGFAWSVFSKKERRRDRRADGGDADESL